MINNAASGGVYTDFTGLANLRAEARQDSEEARRAVAAQFEALYVQMMLKSMRDSVAKSDLFSGSKQSFYSGMYDQQLALHIAEDKGIGLADMIYRQLGASASDEKTEHKPSLIHRRELPAVHYPDRVAAEPDTKLPEKDVIPVDTARNATVKQEQTWETPEQFVQRILPAVESAGKKLGVDSGAILAIAVLETGWGEHMIRHADGSNSYNLFGIKAGPGWQGAHVVSSTLEFDGNALTRRQEPFRAYSSVEESVNDFTVFLQTNPRYSDALEAGINSERFFQRLHKAGYATDPQYAEKLGSVMNSVTMKAVLKRYDIASINSR